MKVKQIIITIILISVFCLVPIRVSAMNVLNNDSKYIYILKKVSPEDELIMQDKKASPNPPTTTTTTTTDAERAELVSEYNVCDGDLKNFIDDYWKIFLIVSPGLLIMMISIDFFKAIMSSDEDLIKKAANNAIKRTAAMIILLMLPYILRTLFGWAGLDFCL